MGWQPDAGHGAGDEPGSGLPGGQQPPGDSANRGIPEHDPGLAGFARGGEWDTCPPSAALAVALEDVSGPGWRCPGAARDELFGVLRQWTALESWAVAGKLGVLRELIREGDMPALGGSRHGDLPDAWSKSLTREVALALAMPAQSAEKLMRLAWDLQARLPGIGTLLADGALTYGKARAVSDELELLTDQDAAAAEDLVMAGLASDEAGKTYGQAVRLAAQAAATVDPEITTRRREHAEREQSRVSLWREQTGAVALAGRDLPADETLAAHARVQSRAREYKDSGAFGDARMDQLRAMAYLDLLNGVTAAARIAHASQDGDSTANGDDGPGSVSSPGSPDPHDGGSPGSGSPGIGGSQDPDDDSGDDNPSRDGNHEPGSSDSPGSNHPGSNHPGGDSSGDDPGGPGSGCRDDGAPGRAMARPGEPASPPLAELTLPLATLLGLTQRPGEAHGLGPLDPDLCRALAAAAAASPHTRLCMTITNADGIAVGHGCARPGGKLRSPNPWHPGPPLTTLPSRVNLTIPAALLAALHGDNPSFPWQPSPWKLTRGSGPGPPGGYGIWMLGLPDGRSLTVRLEPVPAFDCDHLHESHAYQPSDTLRHLVQIRDYECTFPTCSRHARESDFEHALPYHKGGRTCACNAGARSRQCHQVKQSPGWNLTQPRPGWHRWRTPSGRVYTQGPKRYPD